jgi:hypothetical protein
LFAVRRNVAEKSAVFCYPVRDLSGLSRWFCGKCGVSATKGIAAAMSEFTAIELTGYSEQLSAHSN